MKLIFAFLSLFLFVSCSQDSKASYEISAIPAPDSDCDGVPDAQDLCPGIDDKVDNNHDGKPDCRYPPANYNKVIARWKCNPNAAWVCLKTNTGGLKSYCVPYSSVPNLVANGGRLGKCGEKSCN